MTSAPNTSSAASAATVGTSTATASAAVGATQLRLPLPAPMPARPAERRPAHRNGSAGTRRRAGRSAPPAAIPTRVTDDGQRLDEQTRRIGRQGIAAARALLAASETGGAPSRSPGSRGTSGRAA